MRAFHSLALLAFCFLSASRAAEYFPLDPGNRWTYACEGCSGNEAVVSVLRLGPGFIQVDFLGTEIKLSLTLMPGSVTTAEVEWPETSPMPSGSTAPDEPMQSAKQD